MPDFKVTDLYHVRLRSPDLDIAERYLLDFGMTTVERTSTALYMRGTDAHHHLHITELGEPKVVGFAFQVGSADDLIQAAQLPGASQVEPIDEPGGGQRVRITDPLGFQIELVHGIASAAALPVAPRTLNWGSDRLRRAGALYRAPRQPAQVKRIGHMVLQSPDLEQALAWYRATLGLICSDNVFVGQPDHLLASFNRLDGGSQYVDHHVLMIARGARSGMNHISFEVQDFDDVMVGHEFLRNKGYVHRWGVGRHFLGSQIFDYWQDPWGRIHEHWTDTDVLNEEYAATDHPVEIGFGSQWGTPAPKDFVEHVSV